VCENILFDQDYGRSNIRLGVNKLDCVKSNEIEENINLYRFDATQSNLFLRS